LLSLLAIVESYAIVGKTKNNKELLPDQIDLIGQIAGEEQSAPSIPAK
jgi:hypothetical protein